MQIPLYLDQLNGHNPDALAGFRLQRFEVLNWGTFDKRPWVMNLLGNMALLTGANGSGKSTLVDALLTLLVANKRRNYNQASSTTSKKERDEKSYVQGAYGRTRVEESYGSKPKLLRTDGTLTVLLAYFSDRLTKQDLTLAQVLWIEAGSVRKFFATANTELAIDSHFTSSTRIADLKKHLKASGVEVFDEFGKYSQQFRKRLGLQSEKALDLFNQTVSIKEIGGLNDFVRNHMLEKTDVQTKIRELQESYENLTISHEAIQKARRQLGSLVPLTGRSRKICKTKKRSCKATELFTHCSCFLCQQKIPLVNSRTGIYQSAANSIAR
ncbi:ATP-binding protein [Aliterella atlantica]|uniref:ATP-binding protein n=1 Tax=Aliterella atlantica TaxID=1827278 RepID=UPI000A90D83E|nr:ATP-binding protein [Aliterella atlantica]